MQDFIHSFLWVWTLIQLLNTNIQLSANQLKEHEVLTISFDLENTGKLRGTEIAQLYVRDVVGSIIRPIKELKRYKRVTLDPKEKQKRLNFL